MFHGYRRVHRQACGYDELVGSAVDLHERGGLHGKIHGVYWNIHMIDIDMTRVIIGINFILLNLRSFNLNIDRRHDKIPSLMLSMRFFSSIRLFSTTSIYCSSSVF